MNILITGGAGYVGSHVVKTLSGSGHKVLVYDNCSNGHEEALLYGNLIKGDLADRKILEDIFSVFKPDAVMHFAAFIEVGESVINPIKFYNNNSVNTTVLLDVMLKYSINKFIFSSTAAVYGNPQSTPILENAKIQPINPYGQSKAIVENILDDLSTYNNFKYVSLRYFNAAGADSESRIGESHNPESHLIPLILKTAKGDRENIKIYGTDYDTFDGSCIRDYIHVDDLADIHVLALEYLLNGGKSEVFNCGYGKGYSVKEVINVAKKVTGIDFKVIEEDRRVGDPSILVANSDKLQNILGWKPKYNNLEYIISTAWNWEKEKKF